MTSDGSISPEAQAFFEMLTVDDQPTNFDEIVEVRAATRAGFAPASERAIARHALEISDVEIEGVRCERIISRAADKVEGQLVYIFGGAFIVGDPYSDMPIIGALAEHCGVEVIAPHYRLAPEHAPPAAAEDCLAVYRSVASTSPDQRLLLAGESAGGNLALLTAQAAAAAGMRMPNAMALMSPAVDLRQERELFEPTWLQDPTLHPVRMGDVSKAYVGEHDVTDPSISPLFGSMALLPPTIITTGSRDLLLAGCLRLDRQMRRAGVEVECRVWDGLWHVFEYYDDYPEAGESLGEIASFLSAR